MLLSIATIGIYSAWAKVRRLRYFYGNTYLGSNNFEYHAKPMQILIGRVIVIGVFVGFNVSVQMVPEAGLLGLVLPFILPWAVNAALSFNARMTSHRNVRFKFDGSYWGAFKTIVLIPLLIPLTLGLATPLVTRASWNYVGSRLSYGTAPFRTVVTAGPLYRVFGASIIFMIASSALVASIVVGVLAALRMADVDELPEASIWHWLIVAIYPALLLGFVFYGAGVRNAVFARTTIDGTHRLESTLGRRRMVWIAVTNLLATVATLGLLRPWAAIRSWSYVVTHTAVLSDGPLETVVASNVPAGHAGASEFVDIGGIDIGV